MHAAAPTLTALDYGRLRVPMAAFEVLAYLTIVSAASLAFVAGWLTVNGAVVLTVLLLASLIVLSWIHLGQGRHPVFLFLCSLTLFQGGRLIGYCLGGEPDPMQVVLMTPAPFSLSRNDNGFLLLTLALSAICIYTPSRWLYRPVQPPGNESVKKYLLYLYIIFALTLPVQLFKNYSYYQYAMQHGGYTFIYVNHAALASSVPFWVRAASQITLPAFIAIFVFERRRHLLYLATVFYFATASLILLLGSRSGPFMLVASLWWVARVKSLRKARMMRVVAAVLLLLVIADVIQETRSGEEDPQHQFSVVNLITQQGISLNVTEVVIRYRYLFEPYVGSYLLTEVQNAYVANDVSTNRRGRSMANDVSVFLNAAGYREGFGTAGSYIGESYVAGGLVAVVLISVALSLGFHTFYRYSAHVLLVFLFALALPDILLMPKGQLLDWVSILIRDAVAVALLWLGWKLYSLLLFLRHASPAPAESL